MRSARSGSVAATAAATLSSACAFSYSLVMELAQQKQFRLAKIEVFGPNPAVETLLKSKLKPGDAYNWKAIEDFLKENKVLLPPNISPEDLELRRNVKDGTVDLRFNFAARFNFETCSQFQD